MATDEAPSSAPDGETTAKAEESAGALPTAVPLTKNVTIPVGGFPPLFVFTAAPRSVPCICGLENRDTVVGACVMVKLTGGEVLELKLESPRYVPVMECAPSASVYNPVGCVLMGLFKKFGVEVIPWLLRRNGLPGIVPAVSIKLTFPVANPTPDWPATVAVR